MSHLSMFIADSIGRTRGSWLVHNPYCWPGRRRRRRGGEAIKTPRPTRLLAPCHPTSERDAS